jgi:hypothetical protein
MACLGVLNQPKSPFSRTLGEAVVGQGGGDDVEGWPIWALKERENVKYFDEGARPYCYF